MILPRPLPERAAGLPPLVRYLMGDQPQLRFHLLAIDPSDQPQYWIEPQGLPSNVVGVSQISLDSLPRGRRPMASARRMKQVEAAVIALMREGTIKALGDLLDGLAAFGGAVGRESLLQSPAAWDMLLRVYRRDFASIPFRAFGQAWQRLLGMLSTVMLSELPKASVYHAFSTDYAGLMLARARLETGRPALLSEPELSRTMAVGMADANRLWADSKPEGLAPADEQVLQGFWGQCFHAYAHVSYKASDQVMAEFESDQRLQRAGGASRRRLRLIPQGVAYEGFAAIGHKDSDAFRVGMMAETPAEAAVFMQTMAALRRPLPAIRGYVFGPQAESLSRHAPLMQLAARLGDLAPVEFSNNPDKRHWFSELDVMVYPSPGEHQVQLALEAGAAGVPAVASGVGPLRDLIGGDQRELPPLGEGGVVLSAFAGEPLVRGLLALARSKAERQQCAQVMRHRVRLYYNRQDALQGYQEVYRRYLKRAHFERRRRDGAASR